MCKKLIKLYVIWEISKFVKKRLHWPNIIDRAVILFATISILCWWTPWMGPDDSWRQSYCCTRAWKMRWPIKWCCSTSTLLSTVFRILYCRTRNRSWLVHRNTPIRQCCKTKNTTLKIYQYIICRYGIIYMQVPTVIIY